MTRRRITAALVRCFVEFSSRISTHDHQSLLQFAVQETVARTLQSYLVKPAAAVVYSHQVMIITSRLSVEGSNPPRHYNNTSQEYYIFDIVTDATNDLPK